MIDLEKMVPEKALEALHEVQEIARQHGLPESFFETEYFINYVYGVACGKAFSLLNSQTQVSEEELEAWESIKETINNVSSQRR